MNNQSNQPNENQSAEQQVSKICIFTNKYCRYADKKGPVFDCKAPDDDSMTCR